MNKIDQSEIEIKNHPGIKIGNEKYIGAKELYNSKIEN